MNDLLELLQECAPMVKAPRVKFEMLEKARFVKTLGMKALAEKLRESVLLAEKQECVAKEKYPVLTPKKINDFLVRKAMAYNKEKCIKPPTPEMVDMSESWLFSSPMFKVFTGHMLSRNPAHVSAYAWIETPLDRYASLPPDNVLKRLKEVQEKEIFHDIRVATVEGLKDPLLIGLLNGDENRYVLAQWGEDISLDDVI